MKLRVEQIKKIQGRVFISGSKNAVLPLIVCSLLTNEDIIIRNVPDIIDVNKLLIILKYINVDVQYNSVDKVLKIKKDKPIGTILNIEEVCQMRASYYLMGLYVALGENFQTYYPGGCSFSKRPIDYHLDAFRKMGYQIEEKNECLYFTKINICYKKTYYHLKQKSVGTTINIIIASVLGEKTSIITNASTEPEILEVVEFLNQMGANICINNDTVTVTGVKQLHGIDFLVMSDRIEAGSYMLLASCVEESNLLIENIDPSYLIEPIKTLSSMGVDIQVCENSILITKNRLLKPINKIIDVYPSFPTDLQQLLTVLCVTCDNVSYIRDLVYPNRISHLKELKKAEGLIYFNDGTIKILPSNLIGAQLDTHDLRCGFANIMIGTIALDTTYIDNAEIILRGYEDIINKLNQIGCKVSIE